MNRVHFISIGGAVMHNLAIALKQRGVEITGSDDVIFEPARSNLKNFGLLPEAEGWFPEKINQNLDAVVLGMHAHADNPELKKALELKIPIISFPHLIYNLSRHKRRVVVAGSHGKTTITGMIVHVLLNYGINVDFVIGANLNNLDQNVRITDDAQIIIIEGDEYLTSALDKQSKFLYYRPHIAVLTSIRWDHINVFPEFDLYVDQFRKFIDSILPNGICVYCSDEKLVTDVVLSSKNQIEKIPYTYPNWKLYDTKNYLLTQFGDIETKVFGRHNMQNIEAARHVCNLLGVDNKFFYSSISTFSGVYNRLTLMHETEELKIFRDFAHAPDKVMATVEAISDKYPNYQLVACLELHTYSSLSTKFLPLYTGTMNKAQYRLVYFDKNIIKIKKLPDLNEDFIKQAFNDPDLIVFTEIENLISEIKKIIHNNKKTILLMMSSGSFNNLNCEVFL